MIRFEDPHRIFDDDGANASLIEASRAGKLRYIGFTGHKDPSIRRYMLEVAQPRGFTFDAVEMPLNVMDAHYRSFEKLVLPERVRQKIGVIQSLLAKTKGAAAKGEFELFKTPSIFDATAEHPDWLGEEPRHVRDAVST